MQGYSLSPYIWGIRHGMVVMIPGSQAWFHRFDYPLDSHIPAYAKLVFKSFWVLALAMKKGIVAEIRALRGNFIPFEGKYRSKWTNTFDVLGKS